MHDTWRAVEWIRNRESGQDALTLTAERAQLQSGRIRVGARKATGIIRKIEILILGRQRHRLVNRTRTTGLSEHRLALVTLERPGSEPTQHLGDRFWVRQGEIRRRVGCRTDTDGTPDATQGTERILIGNIIADI